MGPGDKPAPGEGPGWDIPPGVSEGVDIDQIAGKGFQTALSAVDVTARNYV